MEELNSSETQVTASSVSSAPLAAQGTIFRRLYNKFSSSTNQQAQEQDVSTSDDETSDDEVQNTQPPIDRTEAMRRTAALIDADMAAESIRSLKVQVGKEKPKLDFFISPKDPRWVDVRQTLQASLAVDSIWNVLNRPEFGFTEGDRALLMPPSTDGSILELQIKKAEEYRKNIGPGGRFHGQRNNIITKLTMVYFGLPVEAVTSNNCENAGKDEDDAPDDATEIPRVQRILYAEKPLEFLDLYHERGWEFPMLRRPNPRKAVGNNSGPIFLPSPARNRSTRERGQPNRSRPRSKSRTNTADSSKTTNVRGGAGSAAEFVGSYNASTFHQPSMRGGGKPSKQKVQDFWVYIYNRDDQAKIRLADESQKDDPEDFKMKALFLLNLDGNGVWSFCVDQYRNQEDHKGDHEKQFVKSFIFAKDNYKYTYKQYLKARLYNPLGDWPMAVRDPDDKVEPQINIDICQEIEYDPGRIQSQTSVSKTAKSPVKISPKLPPVTSPKKNAPLPRTSSQPPPAKSPNKKATQPITSEPSRTKSTRQKRITTVLSKSPKVVPSVVGTENTEQLEMSSVKPAPKPQPMASPKFVQKPAISIANTNLPKIIDQLQPLKESSPSKLPKSQKSQQPTVDNDTPMPDIKTGPRWQVFGINEESERFLNNPQSFRDAVGRLLNVGNDLFSVSFFSRQLDSTSNIKTMQYTVLFPSGPFDAIYRREISDKIFGSADWAIVAHNSHNRTRLPGMWPPEHTPQVTAESPVPQPIPSSATLYGQNGAMEYLEETLQSFRDILENWPGYPNLLIDQYSSQLLRSDPIQFETTYLFDPRIVHDIWRTYIHPRLFGAKRHGAFVVRSTNEDRVRDWVPDISRIAPEPTQDHHQHTRIDGSRVDTAQPSTTRQPQSAQRPTTQGNRRTVPLRQIINPAGTQPLRLNKERFRRPQVKRSVPKPFDTWIQEESFQDKQRQLAYIRPQSVIEPGRQPAAPFFGPSRELALGFTPNVPTVYAQRLTPTDIDHMQKHIYFLRNALLDRRDACDLCQTSFTAYHPKQKIAHYKKHFDSLRSAGTCPLCDSNRWVFMDADQRRQHLYDHQIENESAIMRDWSAGFVCPVCDIDLQNQSPGDVLYHGTEHPAGCIPFCDRCGVNLEDFSEVERDYHNNSMTGCPSNLGIDGISELPVFCEYCGKNRVTETEQQAADHQNHCNQHVDRVFCQTCGFDLRLLAGDLDGANRHRKACRPPRGFQKKFCRRCGDNLSVMASDERHTHDHECVIGEGDNQIPRGDIQRNTTTDAAIQAKARQLAHLECELKAREAEIKKKEAILPGTGGGATGAAAAVAAAKRTQESGRIDSCVFDYCELTAVELSKMSKYELAEHTKTHLSHIQFNCPLSIAGDGRAERCGQLIILDGDNSDFKKHYIHKHVHNLDGSVPEPILESEPPAKSPKGSRDLSHYLKDLDETFDINSNKQLLFQDKLDQLASKSSEKGKRMSPRKASGNQKKRSQEKTDTDSSPKRQKKASTAALTASGKSMNVIENIPLITKPTAISPPKSTRTTKVTALRRSKRSASGSASTRVAKKEKSIEVITVSSDESSSYSSKNQEDASVTDHEKEAGEEEEEEDDEDTPASIPTKKKALATKNAAKATKKNSKKK